jgi:hypothetical protein
MARLLGIAYEGAVDFMTAGDNERRAIFQDDADGERHKRRLSLCRPFLGHCLRLDLTSWETSEHVTLSSIDVSSSWSC